MRWLTFRQGLAARHALMLDWPGAIEQLEDFKLIGEVSLHPSGQELWFVPNGWTTAGLLWQQPTSEWVLTAVQQ